MKKRLPKIRSNSTAERLLRQDLTTFINRENFSDVTFEFEPKDRTINLRVSSALLSAVKKSSRRRGISYQKFIREALEEALKRKVA